MKNLAKEETQNQSALSISQSLSEELKILMKKYYVYILTNEYNKVLYIGVTDNLSRRVSEHKNKLNDGFTKRYNINKLIYAERYDDPVTAIKREKQLKGYTRNKKIELIKALNPEWIELEPF